MSLPFKPASCTLKSRLKGDTLPFSLGPTLSPPPSAPCLLTVLVSRFVKIRELAEKNPAAMMDEASSLLHEAGIEDTVRVGDIYGMMIE